MSILLTHRLEPVSNNFVLPLELAFEFLYLHRRVVVLARGVLLDALELLCVHGLGLVHGDLVALLGVTRLADSNLNNNKIIDIHFLVTYVSR